MENDGEINREASLLSALNIFLLFHGEGGHVADRRPSSSSARTM